MIISILSMFAQRLSAVGVTQKCFKAYKRAEM